MKHLNIGDTKKNEPTNDIYYDGGKLSSAQVVDPSTWVAAFFLQTKGWKWKVGRNLCKLFPVPIVKKIISMKHASLILAPDELRSLGVARVF